MDTIKNQEGTKVRKKTEETNDRIDNKRDQTLSNNESDTSVFDNLGKTSPWMTVEEAAIYLKLSNVGQIYYAVFKGLIKPSRIGRRLRFHKGRLDRWLLSE